MNNKLNKYKTILTLFIAMMFLYIIIHLFL
jgi:hypothetical protein